VENEIVIGLLRERHSMVIGFAVLSVIQWSLAHLVSVIRLSFGGHSIGILWKEFCKLGEIKC
jgi:hypothetical protein